MAVRNSSTGLYDDKYAINNVLVADPLYLGKATSGGRWIVQRYGIASGEMDWANVSNNSAITDYATAWAARGALTYSKFETLTGV